MYRIVASSAVDESPPGEPRKSPESEVILRRVLRREPAERMIFLEEVCAQDGELFVEVATLLMESQRREPDVGLPASPERPTGGGEPGRIGPYRILGRIAEGGMGTVYEATRSDLSLSGRVALKVLHPDLCAESIVERFRIEQRILECLDHPNIVRFLDSGTTEDGRPYFVMDYVEGQEIQSFCTERSLSLAGRLRLFRDICDAVHSAHQHLVIHQDIKPSNILVTNSGAPRLLDFGVAWFRLPLPATEDTGGEETSRASTPEYASPEQLLGEAITTASDVYSLGVLLYELLTGQRPRKLEAFGIDELRTVFLRRPEKPSQKVLKRPGATGPPSWADAMRQRWSPSGRARYRLSRRLTGDLDAIVLKALEVQPGRRYASARELSRDLGSFLEGGPVLARPARRLRSVASVGTVALGGLLTLAGFAGAELRWNRGETLDEDLDKARSAQAREVLIDAIAGSDAGAGPAESLRAAASHLRRELVRRPELEGRLGPLLEALERRLDSEPARQVSTEPPPPRAAPLPRVGSGGRGGSR